jgi:hypothetical protein
LQVSKLCQDILEKRKAELELNPLNVSSRFQKISDGPSKPGKGSVLCKIYPSITSITSNRQLGIEMSTFFCLEIYWGHLRKRKM